MTLPLEGKVALITGGSRGIGKGIALCLAEDGADIVVCARSDSAAANPLGSIENTAGEIEALGRRALAVKLDVTNDDEVKSALDAALSVFHHIDIVVNNAGITGMPGVEFWCGTPEALDEYYRTNLRAPFMIAQLVGPIMEKQGGGAIFNITSGGAISPPPPQPGWTPSPGRVYVGYGITKAGMNRWVAGVAGDLSLRNIAIIAIDPGLTVVERNIVNPRPSVDYSRANTPETTGRAIAFLARDAMAYTGRVLESSKVVAEHNLVMTGMMPKVAT
jgi:NAD(P)-dependent dehydrogenase (short-subunit alcohol dehydrogenase family)